MTGGKKNAKRAHVGFCDVADAHPFPRITDEKERHLYWYTAPELQAMLVEAIKETGEALKEARRNNNKVDVPTLRGLESLSKTSQARKQEAALERAKVINAYTKQKWQTGSVDEEAIRNLYQKFNEMDTKRAIAYGKMDALDSYCCKSKNKHITKKKASPIQNVLGDLGLNATGLFGRMLGKKNNKHKGS